MPKAAFVNPNERIIHQVYGPKQLALLSGLLGGTPPLILSKEALLAEGESIELLFSTWGMPQLSEAEIRSYLPHLKGVFYAAGSVQLFAKPLLNQGVRVFSAWQANALPVAQYSFAQILLANKGYCRVQALTRENRREGRERFVQYPGNYDVRVGLLGCGAIGSRVAQMLQAVDCDTLVFDPFLPDAKAAALGVRKTSLDEIFSTCHVISNHLANLPATVGIIRREHLLSMRPYATFINTGRGAQLSETDLYDALIQEPTRTALLDVMTDEPNSHSSPLNSLENCFITPHIAGSCGQELRRMGDYMIEAYRSFVMGEASVHEVHMPMLDTMA